MAIEFTNVTKKYGADKALEQLSVRFDTGKIYGLLGQNGSGKSTTLKLIAGLVYPNSGQITVLDQPVTRRITKDVAYLTELDIAYTGFSVEQLVNFYASQFADFQLEKAHHLLKEMKLDGKKKIKRLSKGNRGRVKLVLTLARDTPIILLDEPFSGLDTMVREEIVKSLLTYIDFDKQTVIIATHEIDEIEPLLDEVIAIYNGHIIGHEQVEDLREEQGVSVREWFKNIMQGSGV